MSERRPKDPLPDLFAESAKKTLPPVDQRNLPKAETTPTVAHAPSRYLLPTDLPSALTRLDDGEIDALLTAVTDEAKRRGRLPPNKDTAKSTEAGQLAETGQPASAKAKPTRPRASQTPVGDGETSLALGKVNAVRAAFMAGVKPTTIARQFGISQSAVRQVLANEKRKPKT
jgi:hypothetical protein